MTMMIVFLGIVFGMIGVAALVAAFVYSDTVFGILATLFLTASFTSMFFTGASVDNEKAKARIAAYNQLGIEAVNADDYTGNQLKEMYKVETFSGTYYFDLSKKD